MDNTVKLLKKCTEMFVLWSVSVIILFPQYNIIRKLGSFFFINTYS